MYKYALYILSSRAEPTHGGKNSMELLDDDPLATGEETAFLQLTNDASEFNT